MDGHLGTYFLLLFLICCSGFFSASETAYTCLNQVRMKNRAADGDERADKVLKLAQNYDKLISSILIGNNIINILASSLATVEFVRLLGSNGVSVATAVMTVALLLFGEVAPKSIARVRPEMLARAFYPILNLVVTLLTPLNFLMGCWQSLIGRFFKEEEDHSVTGEELITIIEEAESEGGIDAHESELIRSAIEFTDLDVADILTPRVDISAVSLSNTTEEIAKEFAESGYSRLPVYYESIDNIVGILHEKDFYHNDGRSSVKDLMVKPLCVAETMKLSDLLKLLQRSKQHMAIIMDEYGGVSGLVTLEDILEELVGEIWDEHDEVVEDFKPLSETRTRIKGSAALDDFLDRYDLDKKEYESATVSGWVLEELGRIPKKGEVFDCENLHVTIVNVEKHRIEEILVDTEQKPEE